LFAGAEQGHTPTTPKSPGWWWSSVYRSTYAHLPDGQLARRARDGDTDAAHELCSRHREALCRFATRHIGSSDAEDIVQHVLGLELGSILTAWQGRCALRTLLLTAVKRRCIDYLRARRTSEDPLPLSACIGNPSPESVTIDRLRIEECFGRLGARERLVVLLRQQHGLSCAGLANVLRTRIGTVASPLCRAREKLLQCLLE
jgi:RNA polymerase sigma-70 factor (ECF subfamily)